MGRLVAQSVERLTSARVTISWFMSSSPMSGSVLTAQGLYPASDSVCVSLSAPPLLTPCLSLSKINKDLKKEKEEEVGLETVNVPSSHLYLQSHIVC